MLFTTTFIKTRTFFLREKQSVQKIQKKVKINSSLNFSIFEMIYPYEQKKII